MSDRRPLSHLLYTNASGADGHGFRCLSVGFPGTTVERTDIETWLSSLQLDREKQVGWATSCFAVNRNPCFALALVDGSRFSLDDIGRSGGILTHAFLVLIEEGRPLGDFGLAAFDKAKQFLENSPEPLTLNTYLEGCKVTTHVEIQDLQCNTFRGLDPQFLKIFYSAAYDGGRGAPVLFPGYTSYDQLPEHLFTASAVLPPRLRLNLFWRVGLQASKEGFIARIASGPATLPAENLGTAYLAAVRAQLDAGQDDRVARFASSDWAVNSWSGLQQAWDRPAATPRAKDRTARDEDYQALEQDLRDYLEHRLIQLGTPPAPVPPPYIPSKEGSWRFLLWFQKWRPEVYFLVLLLLVIATFLKPAPPVDSPMMFPTSSRSPVPPGEHTDPLGTWKTFAEGPEAVGWFQAVAEARGLTSRQVNGLRKANFYGWSEKLKQQKPLTGAELASSQVGFFEYAHARWAKDNGVGNPDRDVVTLDPMEVAPHLKAMIIDLGLTGMLGSNPSVNDEKVQAAVALAWIRQQASP